MITRNDLEQAIAECQGDRSPNANTCIKLAAFYTIRNAMFGESVSERDDTSDRMVSRYSYDKGPTINWKGDSEFASVINGRDPDNVWPVIDELMGTIKATWPKLYEATINKIRGIPG